MAGTILTYSVRSLLSLRECSFVRHFVCVNNYSSIRPTFVFQHKHAGCLYNSKRLSVNCSAKCVSVHKNVSAHVFPKTVLLSTVNHNLTARVHKQPARQQHEYVWPLLSVFPISWQPYFRLMRLDRPIGTWLLFLPCAWSITMATEAGHLPSLYYLSLFAAGSVLMRGAGCTINDMIDRDIDAKVARTSTRPLPSGQLSMLQAWTVLGAQLSASLAILLTFDWNTVALGASSLLLVGTYPWMKRITYWPQMFLGLAFNFGCVLGWSAVCNGVVDWGVVVPLYTAGIMWTLVYDTIYGFQDKDDDLLAGVKSTALLFGDQTKAWLTGFSGVGVSALALAGYLSHQTWPYFVGVALTASHLAWQISSVDLKNAEDCGSKFRSNRNLGLLLWAAIILSTLLKRRPDDGLGLVVTEGPQLVAAM